MPELEELQSFIQSEKEPIIFLDSCICLHIIKVVDYGKNATNIDFTKIIALKEYLTNKPIKLSPFFGIMELCIKDGALDENKLWDFKHRIDFFEQISLKEFKKFRYDFKRDYFILKEGQSKLVNPYQAIEPSLMNSYCALLKIRSLAINGLTKEAAEKNINSFLDWMVDELDNIRAIEYKLALNIFGGNTVFRKMIGLDCKQSEVKKRVKGTCWDIFNSKNTTNSFRLFEILERNITPFFLTSDANLFSIFKNFSLTLIKDGGENFTSSFLLNSDFAFPHLEEDFIDRQNKKTMEIFVDRHNINYEFDKKKVNQLIKHLEIENKLTS
ncbi:MAG: hypothetical protein WDM90_08020 [Ferruginibacter sp.]